MLRLTKWKLGKQKRFISLQLAYGERDESLVQQIPTSSIPDADKLPVGQTVYLQGPGGQPLPVKVEAVTEEFVTFDMNHEMAGKDLNFEITLVEIVEE